MLKLLRFLFGYVVFSAKGSFPERFMNLSSKYGISFFDVEKKGKVLYCSVVASEYKSLRTIAKKSYTKIKIKEKHGLPFIIKKYKNRKGLFIGVICFFAILYFLSLYVWSIDIVGCNEINSEDIKSLLSDMGVSLGTFKKEVDVNMLEKTVMNSFDNISWLSINIKGTNLSVELKERIKPPEIVPKDKPCNVRAASDGQIIRMEVYNGNAEVNNGDAVVKGQLLINGIVEDSFGCNSIKHADAKVFALTKHELRQEVDLIQTEDLETGKRVIRKRLKAFGVDLPLTIVPIPKGNYKRDINIGEIKVFNKTLPITHYREEWREYEKAKKTLTNDQAIKMAHDILNNRIESELKEIKILREEKNERVKDGKAIVDITYYCEENIAVQEELDVKE